MKIDVTEKYSKFIVNYLFYFLFPKIRNSYGNSRCFEYIGSNQIHYLPSSHVFNVICDVMNVSHDHFGNLHRTSRMTTEKSKQNESQIEDRQNLYFFLQFRDIGSCICKIFSHFMCTCKDFTK